jgi:hypothetical protein
MGRRYPTSSIWGNKNIYKSMQEGMLALLDGEEVPYLIHWDNKNISKSMQEGMLALLDGEEVPYLIHLGESEMVSGTVLEQLWTLNKIK